MPADTFEFTNRVGLEMSELLARRVADELPGISDQERFTTMLGCTLIPVAEVLRHPIARAEDRQLACDELICVCSKWIRELLTPVLTPE